MAVGLRLEVRGVWEFIMSMRERLYLLQVDLSAVDHSRDVGETKSLPQVLQFLLQRANLLVAAQQVWPCHFSESLRGGGG